MCDTGRRIQPTGGRYIGHCYQLELSVKTVSAFRHTSPASTKHWIDVGLMLGQRRRRWPNIKPTLFQCLVFAGSLSPEAHCQLSLVCQSCVHHLLYNHILYDCISKSPVSTIHCYNADLMLGQRRRRWTKIKYPLCQCLVFAGSVFSTWLTQLLTCDWSQRRSWPITDSGQSVWDKQCVHKYVWPHTADF